ncbi:hypothetical protein ACTXT7_017138 [Hymenolepis weldensis]
MTLYAFPEVRFIRILYDNTFYSRFILPKMYICTHVLARPHPSDSYKAVFVFHSKDNPRWSVTGSYASSSSRLFLSTLPTLSLTHFNPRCGSLDYIFGSINSWFSALQLLLALTQTATKW